MAYSEGFQIVTESGDVLHLQYPYALTEITGLHLPQTKDRTTRSPAQHGDTFLASVFEPRTMNLVITIQARTRSGLSALRARVGAVLNPRVAPLHLSLYTAAGGFFRLKNVSCQGPVESNIRYEGDAVTQVLGVRLVAHDPIWYSDTAYTRYISTANNLDLVFPATFGAGSGLAFGATTVLGTLSIQTLGDWPAYPSIQVTGPVANIRIINQTTTEMIELAYTISLGEAVTFITTPGAKDIFNNYGERLQKYLVDGDFASFHIEPISSVAPTGTNEFAFEGIGIPAQILIQWSDRFTSVQEEQ